MSDCIVRDGYVSFRKKGDYKGKRFRKAVMASKGYRTLAARILIIPAIAGGLLLIAFMKFYLVRYWDWVFFVAVYGTILVLVILCAGIIFGWIHPRRLGYHSMIK